MFEGYWWIRVVYVMVFKKYREGLNVEFKKLIL